MSIARQNSSARAEGLADSGSRVRRYVIDVSVGVVAILRYQTRICSARVDSMLRIRSRACCRTYAESNPRPRRPRIRRPSWPTNRSHRNDDRGDSEYRRDGKYHDLNNSQSKQSPRFYFASSCRPRPHHICREPITQRGRMVNVKLLSRLIFKGPEFIR